MATDTPYKIPRWHEVLLLQAGVALASAAGVGLLSGVESGKFWLLGAAIAAIPHALFVYYAGRQQQQKDVRYTLRSTQRGMALKIALTALFFMWAFKANGESHTVVMLLGFIITTLAGAVYPLLRK